MKDNGVLSKSKKITRMKELLIIFEHLTFLYQKLFPWLYNIISCKDKLIL